MAADPLINLMRGLKRAAEISIRDAALNAGVSVQQHGAMVNVDASFASGYDTGTGLTTHPFTVDVSVVGGTDVVTG